MSYAGHSGGRSTQLRVKLHAHVRDVLSGRLLSLICENTCGETGQRITDEGRGEGVFTLREDAKATIAALFDSKIVKRRPVLKDEHQDLGPHLVRILGFSPRFLDTFGRIVRQGDDDRLFILDPSSVSDVTFDEFAHKVLNRSDIDRLVRMSTVNPSEVNTPTSGRDPKKRWGEGRGAMVKATHLGKTPTPQYLRGSEFGSRKRLPPRRSHRPDVPGAATPLPAN